MPKTPPKKKNSPAPKKPAPTAAITPAPPPLPSVTPLIGVSVEKGLLIAVMTRPEDAELSDFRMAIDKPYYRILNAPAARCRAAHTLIRDEKAAVDRKMYLAFIPAPARAVIEGGVPCGAKVGKESVFFSVPTEQFAKIDREKLRKILYVLQKLFEEILPQVLPEKHALLEELAPLIVARQRREKWQRIQEEVKRHLEAKEPQKALDVLSPHVFTTEPMAEAEKLFGDMLFAAYRSKTQATNGTEAEPPAPELVALRTEQLMLEYAISRLAPAAKNVARVEPPAAPTIRALPKPQRRERSR
jgi:hypothetical protein